MIFVYVGYAGKIYYDNFVLFSALTIIIKGKEIALRFGAARLKCLRISHADGNTWIDS